MSRSVIVVTALVDVPARVGGGRGRGHDDVTGGAGTSRARALGLRWWTSYRRVPLPRSRVVHRSLVIDHIYP